MTRILKPMGWLKRVAPDPLTLAIGIAILVIDQLTKQLVERHIAPPAGPGSVEVLGDWVRLSYVTNTGAAFGLLPQATTFLAGVSVIAAVALVFSRSYLPYQSLPIRIIIGLLLGGTLGNLVDRVRLGYVVDFVDVGIGDLRFWAFNVADSSFTIGIIVLCTILILMPDQIERRFDR